MNEMSTTRQGSLNHKTIALENSDKSGLKKYSKIKHFQRYVTLDIFPCFRYISCFSKSVKSNWRTILVKYLKALLDRDIYHNA